MIYIDFQGGAHGNYLEFVCNKFLANVPTSGKTPFDKHGSSHNTRYKGEKIFLADHFFQQDITFSNNDQIISIQINEDDLLPLTAVSLLRAGNNNIDHDQLEYNTYHKLNNFAYRGMLDNLLSSFFDNQIKHSYADVKDPTWPHVESYLDYVELPNFIKEECAKQHNLELLVLDESHPDCPRHVLREFFQIGFSDPSKNGFLQEQEKMCYNNKVYVFQFNCFYDTKKFLYEIETIAEWAGFDKPEMNQVEELHQQFLQKQIFKDLKIKCDELVEQYKCNQISQLPPLTLLEESYVASKLNLTQQETRNLFL